MTVHFFVVWDTLPDSQRPELTDMSKFSVCYYNLLKKEYTSKLTIWEASNEILLLLNFTNGILVCCENCEFV